MKKLFIPLLLMLLAPVFAFAQITAEEYAFVQKCHDNVNVEKKQLSAATADECVKKLTDRAFLTRLRKHSPGMGEAAVGILSFSNALIDLKNIVTDNDGQKMVPHLMRVLERSECPLCAMGLGAEPEKTFEWVGKEAGERLADVKKSVRTWESLGDIRTRSLSSADYNYNLEQWNAQPIAQRYLSLSDWAAKETDKLIAVYGDRATRSALANEKPDPQLVLILSEDLLAGGENARLLKLARLILNPDKLGDGTEPATPSAADKKAKELAAAINSVNGLKDKSVADQADYGNQTFNQASLHIGEVPKPETGTTAAKPGDFVFKELSPKQVSGLSRRMVTVDAKGNLKGPFADEMRGTKAGDEILAFYKNPKYAKAGTNRLDFKFTKQRSGQFGGWSPSTKTMALNSELVNDWMKKNQVTPEQLFEGNPSKNPYLQKLSQYLAPTFVHESTHQRQGAKAAAAGYEFFYASKRAPYQMEMETEAFAMDTSFMAEHLQKRGASYADNLDPFDKKNTELVLKQGVKGVRLANHRAYTQLDSFEGSAAKEFSAAASTAKDLMVLEEKYKAAPKTMSKDELAQMRALRASMDNRFKWYTSVYADSTAAEAKINGWRKEINSKLYPSKSVGAEAPPELL